MKSLRWLSGTWSQMSRILALSGRRGLGALAVLERGEKQPHRGCKQATRAFGSKIMDLLLRMPQLLRENSPQDCTFSPKLFLEISMQDAGSWKHRPAVCTSNHSKALIKCLARPTTAVFQMALISVTIDRWKPPRAPGNLQDGSGDRAPDFQELMFQRKY